MNLWEITFKILIGITLLFAITKILGKTQITQITPFDFISSIVLGELFVHGAFEHKAPIIHFVYILVLWGGIIYLFELVGEKSLKLRGFLEGKPAIVIRNGQIDKKMLQKSKLNINQLLNLLRQKDIFSITEVNYAILEMNGTLSILKNSPDAAPTRQDLKLPDQTIFLPVSLIIDGQVLKDHLQESGLNMTWLEHQLKLQGVTDIKDVFYAEWRSDKGLSVTKMGK